MTKSNGKKVTIATIKSFIKRETNRQNLYISQLNTFDGGVDCVMPCENRSFTKAITPENDIQEKYNLGVKFAWFVGQSRDYFEPYADENYIGYEISNCCGSFILAMHR
jgi:hypothetical protein